jgi:hypothetical protein
MIDDPKGREACNPGLFIFQTGDTASSRLRNTEAKAPGMLLSARRVLILPELLLFQTRLPGLVSLFPAKFPI